MAGGPPHDADQGQRISFPAICMINGLTLVGESQQMTQSIKDIAGGKYVLWGASWSLYTAKVRPYLIKKGIDYV